MKRTEQVFEAFNKEIRMAQTILNDCKIAKDTGLRKHFLTELQYQLQEVDNKINDIHHLEIVLTA
jgi:hypothetical protein